MAGGEDAQSDRSKATKSKRSATHSKGKVAKPPKSRRIEREHKVRGPKPVDVAPWEDKFLESLEANFLSPSAAADAVGRTRAAVYRRREKHPKFRARWDDVVERVRDSLERSAIGKAIEGWLEPIYYQGKAVGAKRIFSPGLTIFMLKAHRPGRYNFENQSAQNLTAQEQAVAVRNALAAMNKMIAGKPDGGKSPESSDASLGNLAREANPDATIEAADRAGDAAAPTTESTEDA